MGLSKPIVVDGFTNLMTALRAAGYPGDARPIYDGSVMQNMDAAVDCYVHFTNNGTSSTGLTGTDGIPIGPTAGASALFNLPRGTDLGLVWLFSASAITVNVTIQ